MASCRMCQVKYASCVVYEAKPSAMPTARQRVTFYTCAGYMATAYILTMILTMILSVN